MAEIAVYQVSGNRNVSQDKIKLALEALGLSAEEGKDRVQHGAIVYTQRDYKDFASIIGTVKLTLTIGELNEGATKEQPQPRAGSVQEKEADASDSEGESKAE